VGNHLIQGEILELSISSETNAYDLYIKMERQMKDQRSAQVFQVLSKEKKQHLERLSSFLEERVSISPAMRP